MAVCKKMVALSPKMPMNTFQSGRTQVVSQRHPKPLRLHIQGFGAASRSPILSAVLEGSAGFLDSSSLLAQRGESARPHIRASRAEDRAQANKKNWAREARQIKREGRQMLSTRGFLPQPLLHSHPCTHLQHLLNPVTCSHSVPHMHPVPMVHPGDKAWVQIQKYL